ncbi:hypothetical protein ANO11243_067960 [Dothideomycetidae sp. 11243]|nr:hypothetical protein ANO11243_067960 [fungal sp. No.11243]
MPDHHDALEAEWFADISHQSDEYGPFTLDDLQSDLTQNRLPICPPEFQPLLEPASPTPYDPPFHSQLNSSPISRPDLFEQYYSLPNLSLPWDLDGYLRLDSEPGTPPSSPPTERRSMEINDEDCWYLGMEQGRNDGGQLVWETGGHGADGAGAGADADAPGGDDDIEDEEGRKKYVILDAGHEDSVGLRQGQRSEYSTVCKETGMTLGRSKRSGETGAGKLGCYAE